VDRSTRRWKTKSDEWFQPPVSLDVPEFDSSRGPHRGDVAAFSVSVLVHLFGVLILALCVLPIVIQKDLLTVSSIDTDEGDELEVLDLSEEFEDPVAVDLKPATADTMTPEVQIPEFLISSLLPDVRKNEPTEQTTPESPSVVVSSEESTVEGAVDSVTERIKRQLANGDLLVVWLLDASHSLVDDRKRVADRLRPFFEEIADERDVESHLLMNAVVSFGKGIKQEVAPTEFGDRIVEAVEKMPVDKTGKENMFAAIERSARTYRDNWTKNQMMIVVWTDETGDDTDSLEETIKVCRDNQVSVSVVGPSSVLGAETGLHSYTDPRTKVVYQLPVNRGPDSALPERIELGYWFSARGLRGARGSRRGPPSWYGGRDLKGIASGFSPYALTRLAGQTGGTYTIFDRPEDRGPFRWETMKTYAPDIRSVDDYLKDVHSHPLRHALHEAVKVTLGKNLGPSETMLFVIRDRLQPEKFERPYMTPSQFARKLRTSRRSLQQKAARTARVVEEALTLLGKDGDPDQPMEDEYQLEQSRRWRAWYDLTRGRLLATSVRCEEYRLTLNVVVEKGALNERTNHMILVPSRDLKSSQEFRARAVEAESLLRRCIKQNPDTPWAYLAEREYIHGLGVAAQERTLTLVPGGPAASSQPRLPNF